MIEAPRHRPPFEPEAWLLEEDTYRVLSADPTIRDPASHPIRIATDLVEQQPETPGNLLVRPGQPHRLLAVVHDLDRDPSWRLEWVEAALAQGLAWCQKERVSTLACERLGCRHGTLEPDRFRQILHQIMTQLPAGPPARIWLVD